MIKVKEIKSKKEILQFVKFPFSLYKDCKYWVPPLTKDELETLDKVNNPVFKNADATYYLAFKNKKIVGRIAVIINHIEVKEQKKKKVRFGWLDMIDDVEVTKALLQKVIEIGKLHKLEYAEGPVGFSNMEKSWYINLWFRRVKYDDNMVPISLLCRTFKKN